MSDNKKLDTHLKNAFGNYSPDVPPHIWDNIVAKRKKKKPAAFWMNRKSLFGLALLFVLLTAGGALFFKHDNNTLPAARNTSVNDQNISVPPTATILAGNKTNHLQEEKPAGNNAKGITAANNGTDLPASAGNDKIAAAPAKQLAQTNKSVKNGRPGSTVSMNDFYDITMPLNKTYKSKSLHKRSKGKLSILTSAVDLGQDKTVDTTESHVVETQTQQDLSMNRLLYGPQKLSAAELAALNRRINPNALRIPGCPADKDAAGNKQYWEIYAGPDRAFKKYSDTANSALLEKRKASTSFQSAYSAGIRFTRVFDNGMSLRGGINYSQINEKFSYLQSNVIQLTYEIGANGDTVNAYYVRGSKYRTSYNHYRTVDIPLLIGYELGNGRFHANVNAGAVVNIYSWQNGETLDTTFKPVSFGIKGNSPYQYKTNIGIGFMGGISFYYKLNDRYHLLAEPYYRYNFSPMNKENLSIQEKFSTMGIRLGLRVDF